MRLRIAVLLLFLGCCAAGAKAQRAHSVPTTDASYGPVVRAYLGYLRAEQEVVDDRISRREISQSYYRRNSNRIRALRQMALRIAHETRNDYLPELEAVAGDELNTLFETPPVLREFRVGAVLDNTFRYLGAVREGETFFLFARLDPYEQAELMQKTPPPLAARQAAKPPPTTVPPAATNGATVARPRRISPP